MDNYKNDYYFVIKILDDISVIDEYIRNVTFEQFVNDVKLLDATMFRLMQVVENIGHLSNEFKSKHQEIPWNQVKGFRNGIVHEYGHTNFMTVYKTIINDLPQVQHVLYEYKNELEKKKN